MVDDDTAIETMSLRGECVCLDFTNTVDWRTTASPIEYLRSYADLVVWSRRVDVLTEEQAARLLAAARQRPQAAEAVLREARTLREAIFAIFTAAIAERQPERVHLDVLNRALQTAMARAEVRQSTDAAGFTWSWRPGDLPLGRVLWPVARSAAELLTSEDPRHVRLCATEGCGWLFLDTSKNHSRRWCSMESCGNRAKARRHYARRRGARGE